MKMLFILFVAILSMNAFAEVGLVGRSTSESKGALVAGSLEKVTINVKNVSGGALEDGDVVVLDYSEDDGYSVNTSVTAGQVPHCVLDEACADDAMCSCQTYGYKSNVNFDSTNDGASAGDLLFISENNAGKAQSEALGSIAASDVAFGVILDDATASGDVEVFIKGIR